jgi:hypothetical protein
MTELNATSFSLLELSIPLGWESLVLSDWFALCRNRQSTPSPVCTAFGNGHCLDRIVIASPLTRFIPSGQDGGWSEESHHYDSLLVDFHGCKFHSSSIMMTLAMIFIKFDLISTHRIQWKMPAPKMPALKSTDQ